ncbi:hypothetical protein, partial [Pectobacterium carotovorum]|uniref:hypothetical protein n=1 Tax=Pectobacterium carotovorum TaxID=554 RepID=UPI001F2BAB18
LLLFTLQDFFISLRYGLVSAHTDCLIKLLKSSATSSVARAAYTMLFRCEVKSLLTIVKEQCHFIGGAGCIYYAFPL